MPKLLHSRRRETGRFRLQRFERIAGYRQQPRESGLPGSRALWPAAFAVALAAFLGSLMILTAVTLRVVAANADSAVHAAPQANLPALDPRAEQPPLPYRPRTNSDAGAPALEPAAGRPMDDERLLAAIRGALVGESGEFGVVVRSLFDGRTASIDPDREFYAASTFKLAVLYGIERLISEGTLALDDRVTITGEDAAEDLGTLSEVPLAEDGTVSIGDALHAMVTISDNATGVALLHLAGAANIDAWLADLGLQHTSVNTTELPTTASDMALLMEAIVNGRGLNEAARDHARSLLLEQKTRWGIPAGLPEGATVGNKTGTWEGATHDIGFVETPSGAYVIAVLSDGSWAWGPIARISRAVYETLTPP